MDEEEVLFKCLWCGWTGTDDEMDMNEHDEPTYCPECGHSSFDMLRRYSKNEKVSGRFVHLKENP